MRDFQECWSFGSGCGRRFEIKVTTHSNPDIPRQVRHLVTLFGPPGRSTPTSPARWCWAPRQGVRGRDFGVGQGDRRRRLLRLLWRGAVVLAALALFIFTGGFLIQA